VQNVCLCVVLLYSPPGKLAKGDALSWNAAKLLMKEPQKFLDGLLEFKSVVDQGKVPKANVDACRPFIADPEFTPENIGNKSKAAGGITSFIINIVIYYDIVSDVEPKRRALAEAEAKLDAANTKLTQVNALVADLNAQLAELIAKFDEAVGEKNAVIAEAEKCASKLDLANRLVNALASENVRWAKGIEDLTKGLDVLVGDVLLASAFVSYVGCFTKKYRDELISKQWVPYLIKGNVQLSPNPDPLSILVDEATTALWCSEGLPSDRVSLENGAVCTICERWPLVIDPQLQAIAWIKEREQKRNLQVCRLGPGTGSQHHQERS